MGYYIYLQDYSLNIKKEYFDTALEAVKAAFPKDESIQQMANLEDVMSYFYYFPELDDNGNICGFRFDGVKLRDDYEFWSALAPFIKDGDYIEMEGEDFTLWRWTFKNGVCKVLKPTIIWEDESNEYERIQRS